MTHWADHIGTEPGSDTSTFTFTVSLDDLLDITGIDGLNDEAERQLEHIGYPFNVSNLSYCVTGHSEDSVQIEVSFNHENKDEANAARLIQLVKETAVPALLTITPSGETACKHLASAPDLSDLQAAVGGYIQQLRVPMLEDLCPHLGYVNEEGRIKGLPGNKLASSLFGQDIVGTAAVLLNFTHDQAGQIVPT